MTRFSNFTDEELDAMESAFCEEGLKHIVSEIRIEREYRCKVKIEMSKLGKVYNRQRVKSRK